MVQALEEEMRSLRRAIRHWLHRAGWLRDDCSEASDKLAQELGLPTDTVGDIFERAAADLRKLSDEDGDGMEARRIIERAAHDLSKLGFHRKPLESAIMEQYLRQLPDLDYQILRHFKQGRKHQEIAESMGMSVDAVRRSLVKTYAELRVRMIESHGGGDDGLPLAAQPSPSPLQEPMQRTSLHRH
jgi:RNA polymerase sigma factor (sigma-70 family)